MDLFNFVCWQLNEVKRKIALVEGKRRALQSSFELKNKENRAALITLGEEVQVQSKKVVLVNDKRRKGCKNIPRLWSIMVYKRLEVSTGYCPGLFFL